MKIGHLFPDLLNLYGDLGNVRTLQKRLEWRGLEAAVENYPLHRSIDFTALDIVLLGGGSDREQLIVGQKMKALREDFRQFIEDGGVVLAICGGYQLLGHFYETGNERIEGLGLLNLETVQGNGRLIGNVILDSPLVTSPILGFENHGGRTKIYDHTPLGKVILGYGNDDSKTQEGVVYKHVVGTYCHGPLLPKNPELADWLIGKARLRRGHFEELMPLNDQLEEQTKAEQIRRFQK